MTFDQQLFLHTLKYTVGIANKGTYAGMLSETAAHARYSTSCYELNVFQQGGADKRAARNNVS